MTQTLMDKGMMILYLEVFAACIGAIIFLLFRGSAGRELAWLAIVGALIFFSDGRQAGKAGRYVEQDYRFLAAGALAVSGALGLYFNRKSPRGRAKGRHGLDSAEGLHKQDCS